MGENPLKVSCEEMPYEETLNAVGNFSAISDWLSSYPLYLSFTLLSTIRQVWNI